MNDNKQDRHPQSEQPGNARGALEREPLSDSSSRKQKKKTIEKQDYRNVFQTIPIPMMICTLSDGTILDVNEHMLSLTASPREKIVGHHLAEMPTILNSEAWERILQDLQAYHTTDSRMVIIYLSDGSERTLQARGNLVVLGTEECALITLSDVTQQQETEKALKRERDFTETILKVERALVVVLDSEGHIVRFNQACENLSGYTEAEMRATFVWERLIPPEERGAVQRIFYHLTDAGSPNHYEGDWITKSGERRRIAWSNTVMFNEQGQVEYVIATGLDVTERRQTEQRFQRQIERLSELRRIQMVISSSYDQSMALALLVNHVTQLLDVDAAVVLLYNSAKDILEYAAGQGFHSTAITWCRMRMGEGYAGRAALERRPIIVPDVLNDSSSCIRTSLFQREEFVAYCGVPLINKGHIKGVLEVFHRSPIPFNWEWTNFLETLAGHAAVVIDNTELVDSLKASKEEIIKAYDDTIQGWAHALELRDAETQGHSRRVTEMTMMLARAIGCTEAELTHLRRGALLHDIGKMGIPDSILLKPGPLTAEEREIMQRHPTYAHDMLFGIPFLRPALDVPHCHHEKWDGTGYPRGLKGTEIPLAARIFSVVDVWDALCSDRPYRKGCPPEKVYAHIRDQAGKAFDPHIVEAFLNLVGAKEAELTEDEGNG